jgi:ABC-type glutathione transport system ATPase component
MGTLEVRNLKRRYVAPDGARCEVIEVPYFPLHKGEQLATGGAGDLGKTTLFHSLYRLQADAISTVKRVIE